jgi:drug/metabolite transporter, DME family
LPTHAHPLRGYFYIAIAAFLWGVAATLGRAAFTGQLLPHGQSLRAIDPLILSQSRTTFSLFVLLAVLLAVRGPSRLQLPIADVRRLVLLGVLGVAASNYLYYLAIQRTNVATAIILQYTAPVWVLLYTVVRGEQKPTAQRIAAVALAVAGIALVIGIFGAIGLRLDTIGVTAALLAAFSFAFYNVGGHSILVRYDRWVVLLYTLLSASLFWMVVNPPWKIAAAHYAGRQWLFLFGFSLVSVLGPFSFYFAGLQHLEPTRAIVVSCLEPVFSIVIAALVLGEILRPLQTLGIVLVLVAIVVVQWPDRKSHSAISLVEPID